MPIEITCPECEKMYKVKDEAAGKKFRCKGCQAVIPIPADAQPAEPDPWDVGGEEDPELPPVVRKRRPAPVKRSREVVRESSGGGMPVTVMISVGINGLTLAMNVLGAIGGLVTGAYPTVTAGVIRILINVIIIKGLLEASNRIRWNAILVDALGLALVAFCAIPGLLLAQNEALKQIAGAGVGVAIVIAIFAVQAAILLVDMILLLTPSARDYCNQ